MTLHHHPWPPSAAHAHPLARLILPALPSPSLDVHNLLLEPSNASICTIYATLPIDALPDPHQRDEGDEPTWVILAELVSQVRMYVSLEATWKAQGGHLSDEQVARGEAVLEKAWRDWAALQPSDKDVLTLGAVHQLWHPLIHRLYSPLHFGPYLIYRSPPAASAKMPVTAISLPDGLEFRAVQEADIDEVLKFSEVPHRPSYLASRLPWSVGIYDISPHASTSMIESVTASASASNSSKSRPTPRLAAAVFRHPDAQLGTLHVHPSYRRQGLARALISRALASLEQQGPEAVEISARPSAFTCVGRGNEASRGLMKKLGWTMMCTGADARRREGDEDVDDDEADTVAWARVRREELVAGGRGGTRWP